MSNELMRRVDSLSTLINTDFKKNVFNQIATRTTEANSLAEFHSFDNDSLVKIAEGMSEANRVMKTMGRQNTQTTNKLMTLTMLNNTSPYRVLRQCVIQIEDRRKAIHSNVHIMRKSKINIEKMNDEIILLAKEANVLKNKLSLTLDDEKRLLTIKYDIQLKEEMIENKTTMICDSMIYVEGALKDIASFQESYKQIKESNNIPDNWDELDVENDEVNFHIRMAFMHAYRDMLAHGRIGMGALEYLHQFGIHANAALQEVYGYLKTTEDSQAQNVVPTFENFECWLDSMALKYKDGHKEVLNRLGVTELISDWCLYKDRNKALEE